ncbi:hypothetical protein JRI60_17240 [Archangium violaceum]|uniref:hypothetical protein n=1 Tax=Archangium violaceum TaxID=83451 RepID=UPI00194EA30C|nr:hypothetical protein [Archangium violaceum]QRO03087.1 hypothetical protein JRI60_17240 [Archangium violaceum]
MSTMLVSPCRSTKFLKRSEPPAPGADDWNEVTKIASGKSPPLAYALVWLSSLLRFIGSKLVS